MLYDVTTLYFEAENEGGLRKVEYSKERRADPHHRPMIRQFQARQDIAGVEMVVAPDTDMLSAGNLADLNATGLKFIANSEATKESANLDNHFHWDGVVFVDGQIIDTITP